MSLLFYQKNKTFQFTFFYVNANTSFGFVHNGIDILVNFLEKTFIVFTTLDEAAINVFNVNFNFNNIQKLLTQIKTKVVIVFFLS